MCIRDSYYSRQLLNTMYIKISPENKAGTLKFLKEKYEEMRPDNVFSYRFFSDALNLNYAHEQQLSRMFLIFTVLAIVEMCIRDSSGSVVVRTDFCSFSVCTSPRRRLSSSADEMVASIFSFCQGLGMKSVAPALIARTAFSVSE